MTKIYCDIADLNLIKKFNKKNLNLVIEKIIKKSEFYKIN